MLTGLDFTLTFMLGDYSEILSIFTPKTKQTSKTTENKFAKLFTKIAPCSIITTGAADKRYAVSPLSEGAVLIALC